MNDIIVLSLFDGMSCGQIALRLLGITPEMYYASEIDPHAIKQTQLNFPDTIQLGDVVFLRKAMCWRAEVVELFNRSEWISDKTKERFNRLRNTKWGDIGLILAGSPCQGFSFAGKQLAFNDPRSRLFFEFIKILNHVRTLNPDVKFLLENVNMKRSHMRIISEYCGVFPVNINSNLVSAQNRDRWYWTNIRTRRSGLFGEVHSDIPQPEDRGIFLRDILEEEVDEKYYVSQAVIDRMNKPNKNFVPKVDPIKTGCLTTKNNSGQMSFDSGTTFISVDGKAPTQRCATGRLDNRHNYQFIKLNMNGEVGRNQHKSSCLTGAGGHGAGNHSDMDLICVAMRGRNPDNSTCLTPKRTEYGKYIRKEYELGKIADKRSNIQKLEPRDDGKTNCLTSVQKDNLILQRSRGYNKGGVFEGKSPTLSSCAWEQNNLLKEIDHSSIKHIVENVLNINNGRVGGISINDRGVRPHRGDEKKTGISELGTIIFDNQKTDTCTTSHVQKFLNYDRVRRLTPTECSRLQTVPAWYVWGCSDTQIYRMLGNGWTVDVIVHILSFMKQIKSIAV